jgi:TRAP-type mannitol/chloroaromatic compound transport system permease large subunit
MTIALFVASLLGFMALCMPIAFALLACGVVLMLHLGSFDTQILAQNLLEGTNSYPLMAVPFFMLAGELMNAGGISRRIIDMAQALVGHLRGV